MKEKPKRKEGDKNEDTGKKEQLKETYLRALGAKLRRNDTLLRIEWKLRKIQKGHNHERRELSSRVRMSY